MNVLLEELKRLIDYNPITGEFRWTNYAPRNKGKIAGHINSDGYRIIKIARVQILAGQLAWFITYGYFPKEVDHEDRNKINDAIINLREATRQQNNANRAAQNELRVKGVYPSYGRYKARITINRKDFYLGTYDTVEEASKVYQEAAIKAFGEFACAK